MKLSLALMVHQNACFYFCFLSLQNLLLFIPIIWLSFIVNRLGLYILTPWLGVSFFTVSS